jgi:hypothetical protein
MSDEALQKMLDYDALNEVERTTGRSYKDDEGAMALGFLLHVAHNSALDRALSDRDDTCLQNQLDRYQRIIGEEGFELALRLPFTSPFPEKVDEALFIYFHPTDAILLVFDTYGSDRVSGGKFYYNWRTNQRGYPSCITSSGGWNAVPESSREWMPQWVWAGDHDCREALRHNIRGLREHGTFVNPWTHRPFMWLLHHADTKVPDFDYKAINAERIAMLPEHVRKAIAGAPR